MLRAERCTARGTRSCGRRAVKGGEARFAVVTRSTSDAACRVEDEQPGHGPADPAPASRTLGRRGSGAPRRTIRMIAAHLHNARGRWVKTLGREHGIPAPTRVDQRRVAPRQLVAALKHSSNGIEALLKLGLESGGQIPPSRGYVWRNLSL